MSTQKPVIQGPVVFYCHTARLFQLMANFEPKCHIREFSARTIALPTVNIMMKMGALRKIRWEIYRRHMLLSPAFVSARRLHLFAESAQSGRTSIRLGDSNSPGFRRRQNVLLNSNLGLTRWIFYLYYLGGRREGRCPIWDDAGT